MKVVFLMYNFFLVFCLLQNNVIFIGPGNESFQRIECHTMAFISVCNTYMNISPTQNIYTENYKLL